MLKIMRKVIIMMSLFFMLFGVCYSAPIIGSTEGTFTQDGSITLSGIGFGEGDTDLLLWDNFESGQNGDLLNETPQIGSWQRNISTNHSPAIYSNNYAHSGTQSSYGSTTSNSSMYSQFACPASGSMTGTHYYISFWFRYSYPSGGTGQTKLIQLWGTYKQGDYNPGIMSGGFSANWWSNYIALESTGGFLQENYYSGKPSEDTWHHCEMILKQSDVDTNNGYVKIRIDGIDQYSHSGVKTRELAGQSWDKLWFFYGFTNMGEGFKYNALDDVYMNDSWARVEIGNESIYSNCTHREIQVPVTWSDSSITINSNQGSFQAGQTAYLYIFDSNGEVNSQGYPIVIGDNDASSPIPLPSPTGLEVVEEVPQ